MLIAGPSLHAAPLEGLPSLSGASVTRQLRLAPGCRSGGAESSSCLEERGVGEKKEEKEAEDKGSELCAVRCYAPEHMYYVINPGGDLDRFHGKHALHMLTPASLATSCAARGWPGFAAEPPAPAVLQAALATAHAYVYNGHGAGERLLSVRGPASALWSCR